MMTDYSNVVAGIIHRREFYRGTINRNCIRELESNIMAVASVKTVNYK